MPGSLGAVAVAVLAAVMGWLSGLCLGPRQGGAQILT